MSASANALTGLTALVTSGPTYEPVDVVRFLGNRSSGRQGHAIAQHLAAAGARTTLVSGPSTVVVPPGVTIVRVETAVEMYDACQSLLPVDIVVCAAAVSDWRVADVSLRKLKKDSASGPPVLHLVENPDILREISRASKDRPRLVVGFAAETHAVLNNARIKLQHKGCDWILANDVSHEGRVPGVFGGDWNRVQLVTATATESWPLLTKSDIARRLVDRMVATLRRPPGLGSEIVP
ncbi:MAG TPA: phosphopantothenoylcysteine decarboxylase [Mycobacterium sp.]|nr:phosphopantothenoylcysteine decarboxylase [Mycobacterium sp.]